MSLLDEEAKGYFLAAGYAVVTIDVRALLREWHSCVRKRSPEHQRRRLLQEHHVLACSVLSNMLSQATLYHSVAAQTYSFAVTAQSAQRYG